MTSRHLCLVGLAIWVCACGDSSSESSAERPAVEIGEETTFVTGPLTADGEVDFAAAYNEFAGAGVTRENNAAVALAEAVGMPNYFVPGANIFDEPDAGLQALAAERMGGLAPGKPLPGFDLDDQLDGPWRESDSPEAAKWLVEISASLDACVEAVQRPRWFFPCVIREDFSAPSFPICARERGLGKFLIARGFSKMGQGQAADAWRDIQAAARLGTLFRQAPHDMDMMISVAITAVADAAIQRLAPHVADQAVLTDMLREVSDRPPLDLERIYRGNRILGVGSIVGMLRGPENLENFPNYLLNGHELTDAETARIQTALRRADPNAVLRAFHRQMDERVTLLQMEDRKAMAAASKARDKRRKDMEADLLRRLAMLDGASRPFTTQWVADAMVVFDSLRVETLRDALDRAEQMRRITVVAVALELYKLDHGAYPGQLDALSPTYLQAVPTDLFTGGAMIYTLVDDTYDLYSVGPDGADNGGDRNKDTVSETTRRRAREKEAAGT